MMTEYERVSLCYESFTFHFARALTSVCAASAHDAAVEDALHQSHQSVLEAILGTDNDAVDDRHREFRHLLAAVCQPLAEGETVYETVLTLQQTVLQASLTLCALADGITAPRFRD